jgi:hypothetical protein
VDITEPAKDSSYQSGESSNKSNNNKNSDTDGNSVSSTGSDNIYWHMGTDEAGRGALTVTGDDIGVYPADNSETNAFQIRIVDLGGGDVQVDFRYEDINWLQGTASGGKNPTAGITDGGANDAELTGSGTTATADWERANLGGRTPGMFSFDIINGSPDIAAFSVCFASHMLIYTPHGPRPAGALRPGDMVLTLDRGPQPVIWAGAGALSPDLLARDPKRRLTLIPAGAFGVDTVGAPRPRRDLAVSRQHRMLIGGAHGLPGFGAAEALIPSVALSDAGPGAPWPPPGAAAELVHRLTQRHDLIRAEGLWSETMWLGPQARRALCEPALTAALAAQARAMAPGGPAKGEAPVPARSFATRGEARRRRARAVAADRTVTAAKAEGSKRLPTARSKG